MVKELSKGEQVFINVTDANMEKEARSLLKELKVPQEKVKFFYFPTNDAWVRDHGPIFLTGKNSLGLTDWEYNAWGNKYPPFDDDNAIPGQIAKELNLERFVPEMVLEAGSIEVNGQGTLLTTESCLLNPNRNPQLEKSEIEKRLKEYLGVNHILWLGEGIAGDDTDGHIDDFVRFAGPNTLICALEEDPQEKNYQPLQENYRRLQEMVDQNGQPFKIITLPMPRPLKNYGERLPASYANFYIANEVVLVPTFADPNDQPALEILRKLFPQRRVVGMDSRELLIGLGAIHCITQQQPAVND